jgi:hypothetical protein
MIRVLFMLTVIFLLAARAAEPVSYLEKKFPGKVTAVDVDSTRIRIEGEAGEGGMLAEIPMWWNFGAMPEPELTISLPPKGGKFRVEVERFDNGRDRLLSRWAVTQGGELASFPHYADVVKARANLPPAAPRSRKGLGGFTPRSCDSDVEELGISSVTVNVVLNFLHAEPAAGRTRYEYNGHVWYVNDAEIARLDATLQFTAKHELMVSAIILVPQPGDAPKDSFARLVAHPDADKSGIFVVPNFTSREGVNAYAAALNFLAERYAREDGKLGRIHHWILHNEVNSGFVWTNAGTKTPAEYMELYHKSLRAAYLIARQYDPNAKVFISLDHHWTGRMDARNFAGRDLLELLVRYSHAEGDFPWAIAYHPYPQDLRNPRVWADTEALPSQDTPRITFKNIEVLDAWAHRPDVLFHGKEPREIHLTEQGLNSPDYSEKALAEQAAGMAYAWEKIEPIGNITAFHYHNWIDNRGEDGLRIGLRKFPDDEKDPLGKKPIWSVYQAIGTPQWREKTEFALPIIGIRSWSELRHE